MLHHTKEREGKEVKGVGLGSQWFSLEDHQLPLMIAYNIIISYGM
jgi:hypothetical protein